MRLATPDVIAASERSYREGVLRHIAQNNRHPFTIDTLPLWSSGPYLHRNEDSANGEWFDDHDRVIASHYVSATGERIRREYGYDEDGNLLFEREILGASAGGFERLLRIKTHCYRTKQEGDELSVFKASALFVPQEHGELGVVNIDADWRLVSDPAFSPDEPEVV